MGVIDWSIVALYILIALGIGIYYVKFAGKNIEEYFIKGRNLSWWLVGFSAVATYTDAGVAPALTMWVFLGGMLGNMVWWIPFVVWMPLSAVLWSKYWRRLKTLTSAEMIEIRYSGRAAGIYRGIYGFYIGVLFTVVLMGYVSSWMSAALTPILGWSPVTLVLYAAIATVVYTTLAGQYAVVYGDVFQFLVFVLGNFIFVPILVNSVGGMHSVYSGITAMRGSNAGGFFSLSLPTKSLGGLTIFAFVVQGLFFAASPTGGEGFTAQRYMAAKNEFHAQVGQLFNSVLTLIVRVVPFIFVGMVGAALYLPQSISNPAMLWAMLVHRFAPVGLTGLLVAGIFAAYMSTISTEMNMGSSYLINDVYKRFIKKDGTDKHYVLAARISSIAIFVLSLIVTFLMVKNLEAWFLYINSVVFAFILPLSWLRFFWWRLNIYGEASALVIGLPLGYIVWFPLGFSTAPFWEGFLLLFGLGWVIIVTVSLLTRPEKTETLRNFYELCRPPGLWKPVTQEYSRVEKRRIRKETIDDIIDCLLSMAALGGIIYVVISAFARNYSVLAVSLTVLITSSGAFIMRWKRKGVFGGL